MLKEFVIVVLGAALIVYLAHLLVKKNINLAKHYGFSGTFIGMTILSIGTSLPEIMTHIFGSIHILKNPGLYNTVSSLVIGTNIGSDIFQQNFILSIVAIIGTVYVAKKHLFGTVGGLIAGAVVLLIMGFNGLISRWEGGLLVAGYLAYLIWLRYQGFHQHEKPLNHLSRKDIAFTIFIIIAGFALMGVTANYVLKSAEILVKELPISASFFGVILIGVAAALPELTTALAALRKNKEMSAGVLIGSNITNPTFALGLGALISTYAVPKVVVWYDLPVKIATALLIFYFLWNDKKLGKKEAIILITLFIAYLVIRNICFPVDF
jgi:cation:H+ antiporter